MKDLLSKEHYRCKVHKLMKRSAYPNSVGNPSYMDYPLFKKKILIPPFMIFSMILTPPPPATYK